MFLPGSVTPGILLGSLTEKLATLFGPGLDLFRMDPFISRSVYILSNLGSPLEWVVVFPHLSLREMQAQMFNMAV